jgi:hypothetical protein
MLRHITFSSGNMDISAELARKSALEYGADESIIYKPNDIDTEYWQYNKSILLQPRGFGYWLWKPYFIERNLSEMKDGDLLLYTDAGVETINNLSYLTKRLDQILLFRNMYIHENWCKMDVMYRVAGWRSMPIKQVQASAMLFRVGDLSLNFVKKWHVWCTINGMIDDSPSLMKNAPGFQEHRHDQAILTCLAHNHNIKTNWWPAQYNDGAFIYEDGMNDRPYPVIFHHHRKRDNEW